ncbi:hypothetical protein TSOC_006750 [Tetrabaena socialis]|uniref:60S ribosomal protein L18a-like protein n=1 Tax=Tetrabaena socialis TaxID=47790 RepID=A0A2J8A2U7_9CHLO|nr:hypothetical protein TSOC_006750 [Tetrabaena socialis]|eukprot:PNH06847.1 hypothetical protein TSOC_006750 [Tetrabaena socialis]
MDSKQPAYPKVPGDLEAPSDTKQAAYDQGQQPLPPPSYPGGYPAPAPPGGTPYPPPTSGDVPYPAIPPAGAAPGPYPGAAPGQPPLPPPGGPEPVLGVPVLGHGVDFFYQHPVWGEDERTRETRFAVCGWAAFVLGFFFPFFWLVAVLLPCCLPGLSVRRAALASCLASIFYALIAIIMAATMRSG